MSDNQKNNLIDENDEIITMTYDDGTTEDFYNLAELPYQGKWYMYLEPVNPTEDFEDGEVMICEIAEDADTGEEIVLPIDDDKLLEKLIEVLNEELAKEE